MIGMNDNVLAVGAHPDDIEMGCGGTLSKHLELGDSVYVLILTQGEKGGHTEGRQECLASLEKLGISKPNIIFGNFPDGNVQDNFKTVCFIEGIINTFKITKVYTHYPNDRHQDHRNVSNAVSAAARKVPEILLFQGPSTKAFDPHYYVEISKQNLDKKINAISCYKTQIVKGTVNPEVDEGVAKFHGASQHIPYAEAFAINHMLRRDNNV
jgi:LmbE family N-acetylglucosaminyl deacetylase